MLKSAASSVSSSQEEFWNFSLTRLQFHLWQQNKKPRNTYFDLFIGKHQLDDRFTYRIDYSSTFARGAMSNPKAEYFCWTPILLYYCILRYVSNLNILVLYDSSFYSLSYACMQLTCFVTIPTYVALQAQKQSYCISPLWQKRCCYHIVA